MAGFSQKSVYGPVKRIRRRLSGWFGAQPPRTQGVYVVDLGGLRVKRVCMADSHQAAVHARSLRTFGPLEIYPHLLLQRESELWVEFIEGRPIETAEKEVVSKIAGIVAQLNRRDPVLVPSDRTNHNHQVHVDLRFLRDVSVLSEARFRELDSLVDRITPGELWIGYDCTDAILKNFILCPDGRVRGIDVESIGGDELIGVGTAKASIRWLGARREDFLDELSRCSAPDFRPYLDFLELRFCAFWLKNCYLERKQRLLDPRILDRFGA